MTPKLVFFQSSKKGKVLEKYVSQKIIIQLICADTMFKTVCGNFFLNNWVLRYLTFRDFTVPKNCCSAYNY